MVGRRTTSQSRKDRNARGQKCKPFFQSCQTLNLDFANLLRSGENGRLDGRTAAAKAAGFIASQHKLGPKANQGAINEKLRALDRTLKPCRKWHRTGFKIKSFTGLVWEAPSWNSQQTRFFGSDGGSQGTSNDMSKDENSSNIGSDNSPAGAPLDAASSPALVAAA